MPPFEQWFPVVTLALGWLLNALATKWSDDRVTKREKEARKELRLDAMRQRRIEFQRATLLELQAAVQRYVRFSTRAYVEDLHAHRKTAAWRSNLLSEEVNNGCHSSSHQLKQVGVRVHDEMVRRLVDELLNTLQPITVAHSELEATEALNNGMPITVMLQDRIGEVLRQLEVAEDAHAS